MSGYRATIAVNLPGCAPQTVRKTFRGPGFRKKSDVRRQVLCDFGFPTSGVRIVSVQRIAGKSKRGARKVR